MLLRAAKNELGEPPRIRVPYLMLEVVGLVFLSILLVSFIE